MTSTLIAGPGEEPVTLAEAKAWCRIDGADDDALLAALIAAARLQVESLTGRALMTQSLAADARGGAGGAGELAGAAGAAGDFGDARRRGDRAGACQGDAVLLPAGRSGALIVDYERGLWRGGRRAGGSAARRCCCSPAIGTRTATPRRRACRRALDRLLAPYRAVRL